MHSTSSAETAGRSFHYKPPEAGPAELARDDLGIRTDASVYWCGQSLFKYLPQFDAVFPRIAREVGDCQFVFIGHHSAPEMTALFSTRLERAFASHGLSAADHCLFLPRLDQQRFAGAIGCCDVILDSIGWSGCNSTFESLHHHRPIVTMPGRLMRGPHTTAILTMMGVTETIASTLDGYVTIGARLARDADWRREVDGRLAAQRHAVYRDRACIDGLETYLLEAVQRAAAAV